MGVIIGKYSGWGKKVPNIVRYFIPIVSIFLFLLKTVLIIPILNLICISNGPAIAQELGITGVTIYVKVVGAVLATVVLIFMVYIFVLFR